jgi:hypothetical protein
MRFSSDNQRKAVMAKLNKRIWVRRTGHYLNPSDVEFINKENEATIYIFHHPTKRKYKWEVVDEGVTGNPKGRFYESKKRAFADIKKVMGEKR